MAKPWNTARNWALRSPSVVRGVCCALAIALGGCRAVDNAQVDVLERELRQQEDYIYELEDYLIEYSEKLRQCRTCQTESPLESSTAMPSKRGGRKEPTLANDPPESPAPRRPNGTRAVQPIEDPLTPVDSLRTAPLQAPETMPTPAPASTPSPAAPIPAPATTPSIDPSELEPPALEIGPTSDLKWEGAAPIATTPPGDEAPPYIPDPADYQLDAEVSEPTIDVAAATGADQSTVAPTEAPQLIAPEPAVSAATDEATLPAATDPTRLVAEQLHIRRVFRDAAESADAPPHSLMVVVEALNATDEPVDADGEVSLMVMAGETQETLERIERWDFTAEETQAAWQSSSLGDGLHLELPLQNATLPAGRLELWARLVNADGVKLLARVPFSANELGPLDLSGSSGESGASEPAVVASSTEALDAPNATSTESVGQSDGQQAAAHATTSQWKAASQPIATETGMHASTAGGVTTSGWTKQAPGRMPSTPTPRVATASGSPRWHQGTGHAPASESPRAWTPFR